MKNNTKTEIHTTSRRKLLTVCAASATIALAGCTDNGESDTSNGESDTSNGESDTINEPNDVAEQYITAIYDGDKNEANALVHPESEYYHVEDEHIEESEHLDVEIHQTDIHRQDSETAETVSELTLTENGEVVEHDDGTWVPLRVDGDEWKVYFSEDFERTYQSD